MLQENGFGSDCLTLLLFSRHLKRAWFEKGVLRFLNDDDVWNFVNGIYSRNVLDFFFFSCQVTDDDIKTMMILSIHERLRTNP